MHDLLTQYGSLTIPAAIILHLLLTEAFDSRRRRRAARILEMVRRKRESQ